MDGIKHKSIVNKSLLSSGKDFKITDNVIVKHPTVEEIIDINNGIECGTIYWSMVSILISDPYENMVMLDDMGIDYEEADCFEVFICKWSKLQKEYEARKDMYDKIGYNPVDKIREALSFFLGEHNFDLRSVNVGDGSRDLCIVALDALDGKVCNYAITRETFNLISEFLCQINDIDKTGRIKPATKSAKKILIEDMRDELNARSRNAHRDDEENSNDYIGNISMALCFGGNGGVTIFNVGKLKIYQLLAGFKKTIKEKNVHYIMNGVYAGTISAKSLSNKEMDWVNA